MVDVIRQIVKLITTWQTSLTNHHVVIYSSTLKKNVVDNKPNKGLQKLVDECNILLVGTFLYEPTDGP
jgi:hypothetical protein